MIFHRGDLVRVVGPSDNHWVWEMDVYIGHTCEINCVLNDEYFKLIDLDFDNVIPWFFREGDLELVDDVCKDLCELNIESFISLYS